MDEIDETFAMGPLAAFLGLRCPDSTCYMHPFRVHVPAGTRCIACDKTLSSGLGSIFSDVGDAP